MQFGKYFLNEGERYIQRNLKVQHAQGVNDGLFSVSEVHVIPVIGKCPGEREKEGKGKEKNKDRSNSPNPKMNE